MKRSKNFSTKRPSRPLPIRNSPNLNLPKGRVVAGLHAVREVIKVRPRAISALWIRSGYEDSADLVRLHDFAKKQRLKIEEQSPAVLAKQLPSHQGLVAFVTEQPEINWDEVENSARSTLVLLDEVEDPHNLGAVLRTSWLMGVAGVLVPQQRAVNLSPAVSKVAQGACEHVPVISESALAETLKHLKTKGFWIYGLSHRASNSLYQTRLPEKIVWVLGSEAKGIRKPLESTCDELVSIPQIDPEASYNVSIAAALALGETFRQQGNSL